MQRFLNRFLAVGAVVLLTGSAYGFTLQGPLTPWMTPRLGYDLNAANFGGPMAITEEYRWNVPDLYYGFTPEFAQYFGERGMAEIDKVFAQLNTVAEASKLNIDDYPLRSQRNNFQAGALGLVDLKSLTLSFALESMGLADPTRYVYTLRGREPLGPPINQTNYYIIRRNYDPDTWRSSPYINGVLWTYDQVADVDATHSFVFTAPVDPLAYLGTINTPVTGSLNLLPGGYFTALTRDDVGGLKYIYRKDNYNIETIAPDVTYLSGGVWGAPPGGTNVAGVTNFVVTAVRPGRDKIRFHRVDHDSLLGFFVPFTNRFEDQYITNGVRMKQNLERPLLYPDILFHAGDTLVGGDATDLTGLAGAYTWTTWVYGNTNVAGTGGTNVTGGVNFGPGTINGAVGSPYITYTYNTVDEIWWNTWPIDNQDEITAVRIKIWGSYNGTTNAPFLYPIGTEVKDVEQWVLRGRTDDPWGAPPNSLIATNAAGVQGTAP